MIQNTNNPTIGDVVLLRDNVKAVIIGLLDSEKYFNEYIITVASSDYGEVNYQSYSADPDFNIDVRFRSFIHLEDVPNTSSLFPCAYTIPKSYITKIEKRNAWKPKSSYLPIDIYEVGDIVTFALYEGVGRQYDIYPCIGIVEETHPKHMKKGTLKVKVINGGRGWDTRETAPLGYWYINNENISVHGNVGNIMKECQVLSGVNTDNLRGYLVYDKRVNDFAYLLKQYGEEGALIMFNNESSGRPLWSHEEKYVPNEIIEKYKHDNMFLWEILDEIVIIGRTHLAKGQDIDYDFSFDKSLRDASNKVRYEESGITSVQVSPKEVDWSSVFEEPPMVIEEQSIGVETIEIKDLTKKTCIYKAVSSEQLKIGDLVRINDMDITAHGVVIGKEKKQGSKTLLVAFYDTSLGWGWKSSLQDEFVLEMDILKAMMEEGIFKGCYYVEDVMVMGIAVSTDKTLHLPLKKATCVEEVTQPLVELTPEEKEEIDKVYYNNPYTIVILKNGVKGITKCLDCDTYDRNQGLYIAYCRAKMEEYRLKIRRL